jgi:hypothetical protein
MILLLLALYFMVLADGNSSVREIKHTGLRIPADI